MDEQRIFHPDQIKIPPDLAMILKEYTKAVIRKNPETKKDILEFSKWYFESLCEKPENEESKS